ncbi:MAG: DsrE family protein [Promethearchaeati archaeon SRVP18_Atabeyarchaeia-1]
MAGHKVVIVFNKAPYERISVVEGSRAIGGVVTMGTEGIAVFVDDGVCALLKNQDPAGSGLESILSWLKLLEKSRVPMKVVRESLSERGVDESDLLELGGLEVISRDELGKLVLGYNSVFVI